MFGEYLCEFAFDFDERFQTVCDKGRGEDKESTLSRFGELNQCVICKWCEPFLIQSGLKGHGIVFR